MLTGEKISRSDIFAEWRFVEADLHDITRRVKEYDSDAALVRSDRDGQLGLARKVPNYHYISNSEWVLARPLELYGEPDARVIDIMYMSDNRRLGPGGMKKYHNELEAAGKRIERKRRADIINSDEEAERAAWGLRKDFGWKDQVAF